MSPFLAGSRDEFVEAFLDTGTLVRLAHAISGPCYGLAVLDTVGTYSVAAATPEGRSWSLFCEERGHSFEVEGVLPPEVVDLILGQLPHSETMRPVGAANARWFSVIVNTLDTDAAGDLSVIPLAVVEAATGFRDDQHLPGSFALRWCD